MFKYPKLPLHVYLFIGVLMIVFIPSFIVRAVLHVYDVHQNDTDHIVDWVGEHIGTVDIPEWENKEWHQYIGGLAREEELELIILSKSDSVVFSNLEAEHKQLYQHFDDDDVPAQADDLESHPAKLELRGNNRVYQFDYRDMTFFQFFDNDEKLGSVYIASKNPGFYLHDFEFHLYIGAILLVACVILLIIRRQILKPLFALSKASSRIAKENYTVNIPPSQVRELEQVSQAFQSMTSDLKRLNQERTTVEEERRFFVSSVVHDLRTPLFSLRGYLVGLKTGIARTTEKKEKYLDLSIEKVNHLDELISLLSDYSKIEQAISLQYVEPVDLIKLVELIKEELSIQLNEKGVKLEIKGAIRSTINGDLLLLRRAFENIISNGIRYSPEQGVIMIHFSERVDQVIIYLIDQGPGLKEDELEQIFKPLYRGEPSRNENSGGIGLGLTISRVIFERHGGTVTAVNGEDRGAMFEIHLPFNYRGL